MSLLELARPCKVHFNPDQSLAEAIDIMLASETNFAPVISNQKFIGSLNLAKALKLLQSSEVLQEYTVNYALQEQIQPYHRGCSLENIMQYYDSDWLPVEDENGYFAGLIPWGDLIVYLKTKMTDSNNRYQAILDSVSNGIITINAEGNIVMLNKAAYRILNVDETVIGKPIKQVFPESNLKVIIKTGQIQYGQKLEINGRTIISNRSPIVLDDDILGAVAVFQDITELESISYKLASVQQLYQELDAIFESSYDGVMITDQDGRGIRINHALARLTGLDSTNFEGKLIADLFKNGIFLCESITVKALREKRTVTGIQKIVNGKEVLVTGNPIFDSEGQVFRVVTNVRDVTELNHLKEEVEQSKLLANRYQAELSEYMLERLKKEKIIAESPGMIKLFSQAVRAARTDAPVLIMGESGVGKEVIARIIHNTSNRSGVGSFIQINCGAIPENLLESELFGYEPGAFTGANPKGKPGILEIADNGTLLLDEIGDLPLNLQVKLLRALQEHEVYRIGGTKPIKLDVRIIAATNRNIWERVQEGTFREDLFYRVNVFPIEVPPLRERKEDILPLTMHFIKLYNEKYGVEKRLDSQAISAMEAYDWPGNVRELQNILERLLVMTDEVVIQADQVEGQLTRFNSKLNIPITVTKLMPLQEAKELLERELISMAFTQYPSARKAAEVLGVDHSNIVRKASKYGLKR